MPRRHPRLPAQWLIVDARLADPLGALARLPRGGGILLLHYDLDDRARAQLKRRLRLAARRRNLLLVDERDGGAIRVHNRGELTAALLRRPAMVLLSPMFPTRSHPDWQPLSRLRASALARLAPVPAIALGGMSAARFKGLGKLGFAGWAAIGAWARD